MFRRRRRGDAGQAAGGDVSPAAGETTQDDLAEYEAEYSGEAEYSDEAEYSGEAEYSDEAEYEDLAPAEAGSPPEDTAASGRHRRSDRDDLGDPLTWTRLRDTAAGEPARGRSSGPWDSADAFPQAERLDLGCLQVPVRDGMNVQLASFEDTGLTVVAVVVGDSALQLQAFAAPRSSGLWEKVRPEISAEVAKAGGRSREQEGPFGPELLSWVTPQGEGQQSPQQPLRFLGADGPRWFLRGLISGPAATDAELARPLEEVFADVVVVRGDYAAPPEAPLDIQLPEEARRAFEEQAAQQQPGLPGPFERGPEITETR